MPIPAGGATAAYADLSLLKDYVGIDVDDTSRDTRLNIALMSATRRINKDTGRRFWLDATPTPRTLDTAGRVLPDGRLLVPDIGDLTGLVVETGSGSTWTAVPGDAVTVRPWNAIDDGWAAEELVWAGGWPASPTYVRITARWGWPETPEDIVQATLIRAAALFKRRDSVEGVLGTGDWGAVRVARSDPDYADLISGYTILAFA